MDIRNPLFLVPSDQYKRSGKSGGGSKPPYYGDENEFESHKRSRVTDLDTVLQSSRLKESGIKAPDDRLFFEFEFDKRATSKSAQPRKLLSTHNIDVEAQISETKFYGTSTEQNLRSFRDTVSKINLADNRDEASYLSAIQRIEQIEPSNKYDESKIESSQIGFLYLHGALSPEEGQTVFKEVQKHMPQKSDLEYFVSPSGAKIIYGTYSRDDLGKLIDSSPQNPILKFEKSQFFAAPQSTQTDYVAEITEVIAPESDAIVAILDTGIKPLKLLDSLIIKSKDYERGRNDTEVEHGTFVASRAIFGNNMEQDIDDENRLYAQVKVMDFRVLYEDKKNRKSEKVIIDHIASIVEENKDKVKVYSLSFNYTSSIHTSGRSYLTENLDALAHKHKIVFIVSAGNHELYRIDKGDFSYPECIQIEAATIASPANGVNVISVGSIADADSTRSLAKNNEPSPFTRHGLDGTWKPDLVHYGGNVDKKGFPNGIGVKGLSPKEGDLQENAGTSDAAPLVSQVTAKIYDHVSKCLAKDADTIDLTKALLLHSGLYNLPENSQVDRQMLRQLTGFGIPDYGRALDTSLNSATFIATSTLGTLEKRPVKIKGKDSYKAAIQKIEFTVPDELTGKDKKIKIKGTLVYTPPINSSGGIDYVEVDIDMNLHYINSAGKLRGGGLTTEKTTDYRNKWNPIKSFEKIYKAYTGGTWEVWLTATSRGAAEALGVTQDYALVITIEDVTDDFENRVDVHAVIRQKHQQYVSLRPRTQVRQNL